MRRLAFAMAMLLLFLSVFGGSATAETGRLWLNQPVNLAAGEHRFRFIPPVGGYYSFFSYGAQADIVLRSGAETLALDGASVLLNSGTVYEVLLSCDAGFTLEVMRAARGKSALEPIELSQMTYSKVVARKGDVHWYHLTAAQSGVCTISSEPGDDRHLIVSGTLLNQAFETIAIAPGETGMAGFSLQALLEEGEEYYLRVHTDEDNAGEYTLRIAFGGGKAESISLSAASLALRMGDTAHLAAEAAPAGSHGGIVFTTSDPGVCVVTQSGQVLPRGAGTATVFATAYGGAQAQCEITVPAVPLQGLSLNETAFTLQVGESISVPYTFVPEDTTERTVTFSISDPAVAQISEDGTLTALTAGEAVLAIFAQDGVEYDTALVQVSQPAPTYRALVAGVYTDTDGNDRVGAANTTQGISDMLAQMSFDGEPYEVTTLLDPGYEAFMAGIQDAFAGAKSSDISLLYINAHGGLTHGTAWLRLADGSRLTAQALEQALRRVPGVVAVIIDCCQSGAFLGETEGFCDAFIQAFASSPFAFSKYKVLTSSAANEDSYRISSDGTQSEDSMATVFGRSLAEGAGWDLIKDKPVVMKADLQRDRVLTLHEIYVYTKKRTIWRLSTSSVRQNVQVYPMGDPIVLFRK